MSNNYKYLTIFSTVLALLVVALGAYTRLSNAGLGCPDWPGCYGFLTVPNTEGELLQAANAFPNSTVEPLKAWIEMIHRYFASSLGLLVIALLFFAFNKVNLFVPKKLTVSLFVLILFQGFLGMLTVTMNLQPFIVMGHLLGGFCILALLALHCFHLLTPKSLAIHKSSTFNGYMSELSISILVLQIALGGWVAANYAAPHCVGLPICENIHLFSTESLFHLPVGEENYEYGVLPFETRLSIHMVHRGWAVVTLIVLAVWAWKVYQAAEEPLLKNASVMLPQIISEQNAFLVSSALHSAIWGGGSWKHKTGWVGTGWRAQTLKRRDLSGKTGTTNNSVDTWFTGYNRNVLTTVWVGFDDASKSLGRAAYNNNLGKGQAVGAEAGAITAQPAWVRFMKTALQNEPLAPIDPAPGLTSVRVDLKTGLLSSKNDHTSRFEYFESDTVPTKYVQQDKSKTPFSSDSLPEQDELF